METISSLFQALYNSPHYSFGWVVMAFLSVLPAIVSGNMVLHHLSLLGSSKSDRKINLRAFLFNLAAMLVCIAIMAYAFYLYIWQ